MKASTLSRALKLNEGWLPSGDDGLGEGALAEPPRALNALAGDDDEEARHLASDAGDCEHAADALGDGVPGQQVSRQQLREAVHATVLCTTSNARPRPRPLQP